MKNEIKLNENDNKLLAFCSDRERSINDISRYLNIAPSSVVTKVKKLLRAGLIKVETHGKGKKTFVRTKSEDKTKGYMIKVLQVLKKNKGEMLFRDFVNIYPLESLFEKEGHDKSKANRMVLYSELVEHIIRITPKGKQFLKEHSKGSSSRKN